MEKRAYTDSEKMELMKKIMKMVGLEHIDFGQKARSLSGGHLRLWKKEHIQIQRKWN